METVLHEFARVTGQPDVMLREQVARQICTQFNAGGFTAEEMDIVKDILLLLSEDMEVRIRRVLAFELKENPNMPHSVALKLAHDVQDVALPVLEFASVLTPKDLLELVHATREAARHSAIARRSIGITPDVSRALISTGHAQVAGFLFGNANAQIDDRGIAQAFILYKDNGSVLERLVQCGGMSVALAERLIASASTNVQGMLAQRFGITNSLAQSITEPVHAQATIDVHSVSESASKSQELVNQLFVNDRLTHSVILRALCQGEIEFFETGMAKLAGIPLANAHKLIRQGNGQGFQALYRACNMPETMLEATEMLVRIAIEEEPQAGKREVYSSRMIQRITERGYDRTIPNMGYMLALLNDKSKIAASLH
jgi:uncharacterized protein (DUF2336 family)